MELNKALQQGITALKEGKLQEAERLYWEILQTHPTHPYANHNLGITLYTLGRLKDAEASYKEAISTIKILINFFPKLFCHANP